MSLTVTQKGWGQRPDNERKTGIQGADAVAADAGSLSPACRLAGSSGPGSPAPARPPNPAARTELTFRQSGSALARAARRGPRVMLLREPEMWPPR